MIDLNARKPKTWKKYSPTMPSCRSNSVKRWGSENLNVESWLLQLWYSDLCVKVNLTYLIVLLIRTQNLLYLSILSKWLSNCRIYADNSCTFLCTIFYWYKYKQQHSILVCNSNVTSRFGDLLLFFEIVRNEHISPWNPS